MYLDFEKPIQDLQSKLDEMKTLAEESDVDVAQEVKSLEEKIKTLKKDIYSNLSRWQKVQLSRHPDRPYTLDYIENMCDQFIELHGDRFVKDDMAIVGGFAEIGDQSVMVIGHQKGKNTKMRQLRNFGMANQMDTVKLYA